MSNKEAKKVKTFFLKLSPYLKCFVERKYGNPVQFPVGSIYYTFMQRSLVNNPSFKKLSDFSYSSVAFNMSSGSLFTVGMNHLSEDEKKNFVEIVMPAKLYRIYGNVIPSSTYEISPTGAKAMRAEIKREFWIDFSKFYDECKFRAGRIDEEVTLKNSMADFIILNQIDMGDLDKLLKYWHRWKSWMKNDTERKRENAESELGVLLENTP